MSERFDPSNINTYLANGQEFKDWYDQEANRLVNLLPEFSGLPVLKVFAITSILSSIESNVHQAIKALMQWRRGEEFNGFLPAQIKFLNLVKEGKEIPGRKVRNFIEALEGNPLAVVVDLWMVRAFNMQKIRTLSTGRTWEYSPSKSEYNQIADFVRGHAPEINVEPRQYQSILWCGIRKTKGYRPQNQYWSDLVMQKRGTFPY